MDPIGLPIQSSLAGVSQSERQQVAERAARDRQTQRPRRAADEAEFGEGVAPTESVEAARSAKGNDQEEAHEDRQARDLAHLEEEARRRRIDLEG